MKIAFVITEVSGVSFYRAWQPAMALRAMGHEAVFLWHNHSQFTRPDWEWKMDEPENFVKIRRDLDFACEWADMVIWQALHTESSIRFYGDMRLKHHGKPFILELDDIVFDIPAYNAGSVAYYPGSPLTAMMSAQIKESDGLIVSTPFLKSRLAQYHRNIHVVENSIDCALWRPCISPGRQRATIGWVGGATHEADLEMLRDVVPQVLDHHPEARFLFVHGCPEFFKHKPDCEWLGTNDPRYNRAKRCHRCGGIDRVDWTHAFKSIDKYPAWISGLGIDIGLAPLVDNVFNRAKSNLRWLEYSAMCIPTVASPVENFNRSITDGVNGLFADTPEEWVGCISKLITDTELRRRIGESALARVKAEWTPTVQAEKYLRIAKELTNATSNTVGPGGQDRGFNPGPVASGMDRS